MAAGGGGGGKEGGDLDLEEGEQPTFEQPPLRYKPTTPPTKESVRAQVARALVAIIAVVILFSFLTLWLISPPPGIADLEKLLTVIFGPLVALVSGAVGYYFGGKSEESQGGG